MPSDSIDKAFGCLLLTTALLCKMAKSFSPDGGRLVQKKGGQDERANGFHEDINPSP
jgi:hypothetical protein